MSDFDSSELFSGPPSIMPPPSLPSLDNKRSPSATETNLRTLSESLMNITQPYGSIAQPPIHQDDPMDIEMEDIEKPSEKTPISEQLQQMAGYNRGREEERRDRRDDNRDRRNRSRERDRDR